MFQEKRVQTLPIISFSLGSGRSRGQSWKGGVFFHSRAIGISSPNNQRQHRTLHIQKDVLPYALCYLLCPASAALASIFRTDLISTSYTFLLLVCPLAKFAKLFCGYQHCRNVQRFLAQRRLPPPQDRHRSLGMVLLQGPTGWWFLPSEVPLYACTRTEAVSKGLGSVVLGFREFWLKF